ncbi:hypothetical protein L1N85_11985 [Paenibacillus alkaliterrae]|uniref:hypothetical protein n=1 Tax=Paenibacillus alkaliterrae TaxID=320909 RepID=UPI001F1D172A|nr:hypothetical protein [Paenibacillus alkaliterrae]MCF2939155.1 hypothetical protein [Paenibacillus alkaliterrae]
MARKHYNFGKHSKKSNAVKWKNSKTRVNVKQKANAFVFFGGNAIAVNASDIGVVRTRPGNE